MIELPCVGNSRIEIRVEVGKKWIIIIKKKNDKKNSEKNKKKMKMMSRKIKYDWRSRKS